MPKLHKSSQPIWFIHPDHLHCNRSWSSTANTATLAAGLLSSKSKSTIKGASAVICETRWLGGSERLWMSSPCTLVKTAHATLPYLSAAHQTAGPGCSSYQAASRPFSPQISHQQTNLCRKPEAKGPSSSPLQPAQLLQFRSASASFRIKSCARRRSFRNCWEVRPMES